MGRQPKRVPRKIPRGLKILTQFKRNPMGPGFVPNTPLTLRKNLLGHQKGKGLTVKVKFGEIWWGKIKRSQNWRED